MRTQRALLTAVWIAFGCAACNDADAIAHPSASSPPQPDAATLSCDYASQLARNELPSGLANVFVDCDWPLRADDSPDDLRDVIGEAPSDRMERAGACSGNPYKWWFEPPAPGLPQRVVYCPRACEAVKAWIRCKLRDDPCNQDDSDAAISDCSGKG